MRYFVVFVRMLILLLSTSSEYSQQESEPFTRSGYQVLVAYSQAEALQQLSESDSIQLIVFNTAFDVEVLQQLLVSHALPVVLLTSAKTSDLLVADAIPVHGILLKESPDVVYKATLHLAIQQFKSLKRLRERLRPQRDVLAKLNSLLRSIYHINRVLISYSSDEEVMHEICQLLVAGGSFRMAWIGLVNETTRRVEPRAIAGDIYNYVQGLEVYADDRPEGHGPIGIAIRTNKSVIVKDAMNDPRLALWAEQRKETGWNSSIAVPFRMRQQTDAILVVYSDEIDHFDEPEVTMLEAVASNFQLAIERITAEEETRNQLTQKTVLLKEVHHRTKNNIVAIESLLFLQLQRCTDEPAAEVLQDAINRVKSMRALYDHLLVSDDFKNISVKEYVLSLIDKITLFSIDPLRIKITHQIDEFSLDSKRIFSIGIIINELLTNAAKYAFNDIGKGEVIIQIMQLSENILLCVDDNGVGVPENFSIEKSKGFGLMLVNILVQELKGTITIGDAEQGTKITISFPK